MRRGIHSKPALPSSSAKPSLDSVADLDISAALAALSDDEDASEQQPALILPEDSPSKNPASESAPGPAVARTEPAEVLVEVPAEVPTEVTSHLPPRKRRKLAEHDPGRFVKTKLLGSEEEVVLDLKRTVKYVDPDKPQRNEKPGNFRDQFLAENISIF